MPNAVWREVGAHRPAALASPVLEHRHAQPVDPRVVTLALTFTLHQGEREALALLASQREALFITDDTAARLAAQTITHRVHGTVGLVIRALRRGQRNRDEVIRLLQAIPERTTLYIKPALLEEVISRVESDRG